MSETQQEPRYSKMFKHLRTILGDEKECFYFLHTPHGALNVSTFSHHIPGFVGVAGVDENKKYRFFLFSEESILSFGLEIRRKHDDGGKQTVGFRPASTGESHSH
jgi:hypothetical protein